MNRAAIALNRFGLGARPEQVMPGDPAGFLLQQFDRFEADPPAFAALADPSAGLLAEQRHLQALRQSDADPAALQAARKARNAASGDLYRRAVTARLQSALDTEAPFVERLVHFWSNHLCISADNARVSAHAGAFEQQAIRPHVLGRFSDMLLAAERHPAMLLYLNQAQSIGPDSPAAARDRQRDPSHQRGLNENLGREIMELHTLGVRSGYDQADVTEFARALTGWTVSRPLAPMSPDGPPGEAAEMAFRGVFRPALHEPGPRTVLGRVYPEGGAEQSEAILLDLARSPATATHLSTKLARHFSGDIPPPALVARLAASFRDTGGDLPSLYRVLVRSPECWATAPRKFKTPWEWSVSALRGLGVATPTADHAAALEGQLGQPVWRPGAPAGWDDIAATWAAPDALMQRVRMASVLAAPHADRLDARTLAPRLLPGALSAATAREIAEAESPSGALALLLVSPDFLRR